MQSINSANVHCLVLVLGLRCFLFSSTLMAQETNQSVSLSANVKASSDTSESGLNETTGKPRRPVQALLVTGGCCHDYERQKLIITRGISARADVRWTVVHQGGTSTDSMIALYENPDWAEGFDVVVHNECFADVTDQKFVDGILKPHRDGLPAVLIHCAMHSYRTGDDRWFEFCGIQSPGHGPHYSYAINNLNSDHPVMHGFGDRLIVPRGELYHAVRVFPTATPLASARRQDNDEPQVCVWTNNYHGTRVFGTTVGHYNETMAEPVYLDMLARGLLWAVGRDPETELRAVTAETEEMIRSLATAKVATRESVLSQGCCGEGNLAFKKPARASSEETGKNNFAGHAVDGRLDTRWCANGPRSGESLTLDLESVQAVRNIRIHWESANTAYQYTIESSEDGNVWTMLADRSANRERNGLSVDAVESNNTRFLRVTFVGSNGGGWGSLWELEVYPGELPPLPAGVITGSAAGSVDDVAAPDGFSVSLFAGPPQISHPVCITTSIDGEVFVGVDEQGSLGKEKDRGRVVRCLDTDGDGQADTFTTFARMDHPRGLIYDAGTLWVLHPPFLSVFHDHDGDGVADSSEVLIEGISTDEVSKRGADHTTNGIRMGIDGWIYIAVGDFGFHNATGRDGQTLSRRGGGVVRVRPDGTEMEIFSWGQRNIVDVAIDPFMNLFTRDNTNDGGGWDTRLSHVIPTANYGYPSHYINFTEETMPALADYGGGSGCGVLYLHDDRWPQPWNDILLTCDWGRSEVFSHQLPARGATFDAQQDVFLKIPRPTDADIDASGRLFVSSWKNGGFSFERPDVGFVAMITPKNHIPHPVTDLSVLPDADLVHLLKSPSASMRLAVQRTLLRRTSNSESGVPKLLMELAGDHRVSPASRVAAVWTLRQFSSESFKRHFPSLLIDRDLREHAIRAAADRRTQIDRSLTSAIFSRLDDDNPRVVAAAIVALARMDEVRAAAALLNLVQRTEPVPTGEGDLWRQADPGRVIPHLAVRALADLRAVDTCLNAISGASRDAAFAALKYMHDSRTVDGLFQILSTSREESLRQSAWSALIRLYHREGEFTPSSPGWWGTRPDTSGPYYDRQTWEESERIAAAVRVAYSEADAPLKGFLTEQLNRHVVRLEGLQSDSSAEREMEKAVVMPMVNPEDPNAIANLEYDLVLTRASAAVGDPERGRLLFRQQSCVNCHTYENGQQPRGPHLVDIGKRYRRPELVESIVLPGKKIAQGFDTWAFAMEDGRIFTGFVVLESADLIILRDATGIAHELPQNQIDDRVKQDISMMPQGIVGNLSPEQLADLIAFLESLH